MGDWGQKILIGFAVTALTAMGAGVIRHEVVLAGMSRDVAHTREKIDEQGKTLGEIHKLLLTNGR